MSTEECKHSYCGEYIEITHDTLYNSRTVHCEKVTLVFKEIYNNLLNSSTDVKTSAVYFMIGPRVSITLELWSTICPQ